MKKRKLIMTIAILTVTAAIGSVSTWSSVYAKESSDSSVISYNPQETAESSDLKTTKYKDISAKQILNNNKILVLKDNGVYSNPDADIPKSYISLYDVDTKEFKDYKNINMSTREFHGVSPSGRYVLFGEPRIIPEISSKEWQQAVDSGELFNEKRDILDLETGEVIENFDKTLRNYEANYKWINDDYIFVDYGASWAILNKQGNAIKEGKFDFTGFDGDYSHLIDVSEIKVENNDISGNFYYFKDYIGSDKNTAIKLYSMDVNTKEEKLINNCNDSFEAQKQGNIIAENYFIDSGDYNENGVVAHRTFAFKFVDKNGSLVRDYQLPEGKYFNSLVLSPNGEKCAFIEQDSFMNPNRNTLNNKVRVMDVRTGEIKDAAKVEKLMDKEHEEDFFNYKIGDKVIAQWEAGRITDISWNNTGDSLMFNYSYTSKDDGENHTDTYIVSLNN